MTNPSGSETETQRGRCHTQRGQEKEADMPVFIVPLLVGVPVVLGGGYLIYHLVH